MNLPELLKSARDKLGLIQPEMAAALDLSMRAYHSYESGERTPHILIQEGIAARLAKLKKTRK